MGFFDHPHQISGAQDNAASPMLWAGRARPCGVRLSLDRTRSVPVADQTGKSVIYVVPHESDTIECWSGEDWVPRKVPYDLGATQTRAVLSLDISGCANATVYDVFVRNISGPWEIKYVPWNSTTARATPTGPDMNPDGLGVADGRTCYAAMAAVRAGGRWGVQPDWFYLGSFYTSAAGVTDDSATKRFLANHHNPVRRHLNNKFSAQRSTTSSAFTELNTEIQCQWLTPVGGQVLVASASGTMQNTNAAKTCGTGIGVDSASVATGAVECQNPAAESLSFPFSVLVEALMTIGYHYVTVLGRRANAGTAYWESVDGNGTAATRLWATVWG